MAVDQHQLQAHLTSILQSDAGIRNEARRQLAPTDPANPFGWSDPE